MPRKPEPSLELKTIIWDVAATVGKDKPEQILRQLDYELEKRRADGSFFEDTPDKRTISRIVEKDINNLPPEAVVSKLPPHVWRLRDDYESLKQLAAKGIVSEQDLAQAESDGRIEGHVLERDPLTVEARKKHSQDLWDFVERFERALDALVDHLIRRNKADWTDGYQFTEHVGCQISRGQITAAWLHWERHPLFACLRSHWEDEDVWKLYEEWKESFWRWLQLEVDREMCTDKRRDDLTLKNYGTSVVEEVFSRSTLLDALWRLRLKRLLPGKCELCP